MRKDTMALEITLAGGLMTQPGLMEKIDGIVTEKHFSGRLTKQVFRLAKENMNNGHPLDMALVMAEFDIEDVPSVSAFMDNLPVVMPFHAERLRDAAEGEWPDPLPIKSELPSVEPLTEEMIPEPFWAWVLDAANRMQVPPEYITAPLLIVCGSVVGTSCRIRPKQKDDWAVVPNLWGGVIGPPSQLKTPALNEAVNKTLGRLEAAAREDFAKDSTKHEADAMLRTAKIKAIKADIEKAVKKERGRKINDEKS